MRPRTLVTLLGAVVASGVVHAQGAKPPVKRTSPPKTQCASASESASWVKGQRALLAESPTKWTTDSLRSDFKNALGQAWTDSPDLQYGWALADTAPQAHDSSFTAMVARMRRLGRGALAPTRTTVGVAGMRGMFVLASSDTGLLRSTLRRMMEAGPDEGIKPDIALMEDRVRLQSGRKQLYGTQLHIVGTTLVPFAIEDSAHVDLRRDAASLPPLAWSLCNAQHQLSK